MSESKSFWQVTRGFVGKMRQKMVESEARSMLNEIWNEKSNQLFENVEAVEKEPNDNAPQNDDTNDLAEFLRQVPAEHYESSGDEITSESEAVDVGQPVLLNLYCGDTVGYQTLMTTTKANAGEVARQFCR